MNIKKQSRFCIKGDNLKLFYPARDYPHKNHKLLFDAFDQIRISFPNSELLVTLEPTKVPLKGIKALGEITENKVHEIMDQDDTILVFPSLKETLGLPLVEALELDIPIIAANLPYAREVCGKKAIYFDPDSIESLISAIAQIQLNVDVKRVKRKIDLYEVTAKHILKLVSMMDTKQQIYKLYTCLSFLLIIRHSVLFIWQHNNRIWVSTTTLGYSFDPVTAAFGTSFCIARRAIIKSNSEYIRILLIALLPFILGLIYQIELISIVQYSIHDTVRRPPF